MRTAVRGDVVASRIVFVNKGKFSLPFQTSN